MVKCALVKLIHFYEVSLAIYRRRWLIGLKRVDATLYGAR